MQGTPKAVSSSPVSENTHCIVTRRFPWATSASAAGTTIAAANRIRMQSLLTRAIAIAITGCNELSPGSWNGIDVFAPAVPPAASYTPFAICISWTATPVRSATVI